MSEARMRARLSRAASLPLVAAMLALAACSPSREPIVTGSVPQDGYKTRHPIMLRERPEIIDLPVGSQAVRLTDREAATVTAFAEEALERGASNITVLMPRGSANQRAAARVSRDIAAALARGGMAAGTVTYQSYTVPNVAADAPVRLAYARMSAGLDHACSQWPDQVWADKTNADYWNFGCATQANLAAMVVDPTDLVTARGVSPPNATRRKTIFQHYENGESTTSQQQLKQSGTITQLGGG